MSAQNLARRQERPAIAAITEESLYDCAAFLHANLDASRSVDEWMKALRTTWGEQRPNYGYYMRVGIEVVGVIGAYYADRTVRNRVERFCNITSWCVLDEYRQQSMRLAMSVTSQPGYHFTDLSPTSVVSSVLQFLKFRPLDSSEQVILNIPLPFSRAQILDRPDSIKSVLRDSMLRIYEDHETFPWLRHVLLGSDSRWCHVIFKIKRLKGLPSARVLYLSDPDLFCELYPRLAAYLLFRGIPTSRVEARFLTRAPKWSLHRAGGIPRLYLSQSLTGSEIDNLYSEQMALDL